ncbi:hypothetical protein D3C71_2179510 [compost metagenome]
MVAHRHNSACLMPAHRAIHHRLTLALYNFLCLIVDRTQLIAVERGILSAGILQLVAEFIRTLQIIMLTAEDCLALQRI